AASRYVRGLYQGEPVASGLTGKMVAELMESGLTGREIAAAWGVTPGRVSQLAREAGYRSPKKRAMDPIPSSWELTTLQRRNRIYQDLRIHLHAMAGLEISEASRARLNILYRRLRDYVVVHDPAIPSTPNNKHGAFRFEPRASWDEDLLIRQNRWTRIDPGYEKVWRLPPDA